MSSQPPASDPSPNGPPADSDPAPAPEAQPQPDPAPEPEPATASDSASDPSPPQPAQFEKVSTRNGGNKAPGGLKGVVHKARGHGHNVLHWAQSHPLQAGLIGTGVAIGTLVAGWTIFRVLRGRKGKKNGGNRRHARSLDGLDAIKAEFPVDALEKRAVIDELDLDDEEFLEFLSLLPTEEEFDIEAVASALEGLELEL